MKRRSELSLTDLFIQSTHDDPIENYYEQGSLFYDRGEFEVAYNWYLKASLYQNSSDAQYRIGIMYHLGDGVIQDFQIALNWYLLAAQQNHSDAQYNIGVMYHLGKGMKENYDEAMNWYLLAAEKNHSIAQYSIGTMFINGDVLWQSMKEDYDEALMWYLKSYDSDPYDEDIVMDINRMNRMIKKRVSAFFEN